MKITQVALLGAVTVVAAQQHNHLHRHPARHGAPVEARGVSTTVVTAPGPVVTVFELNGHEISYDDVEEGLKDGKYVLIGDTSVSSTTSIAPTTSSTPKPTSTSTSTTPPPPPPPPTTSSSVTAAEFYEKPSSSTSETPTPTPKTSATPTPTPAASSESSYSSSSSSSTSSTSGNWPDFPSGTIPCSHFPSEYGALPVDWLGTDGWTGIQIPSDFSGDLFSGHAISNLATAVSGNGCTKNTFCTYACGAGFQMLQWPKSQGAAGQSVGGLYCNNNGFLELTRDGVSQICGEGAGGVTVKNSLSKNVAVCRTQYPGTESEVVPLDTQPGQTYPLTNPVSADYYTWEGSATTAQYYVNPAGAAVDVACIWNTPGSNLGNYAPGNIGTGVGAGGITYMSLFPNHPSNPDGTMNYNIRITGSQLGGDCSYTNGAYYSNGAVMPNGCTVSFPKGGNAVIEFY